MPLTHHTPIAFIPTNNPAAARAFYEHTLGLTFVSDDNFALVFRFGPTGTMLRIVRTGPFTPLPFTLFGWETGNLSADIAALTTRGLTFLRFPFLQQDQAGIWTAPDGAQVAWFHDPDGNTLSLSHHPAK